MEKKEVVKKLWETFLASKGEDCGIAIHCENLGEARELLSYLHNKGFRWASGLVLTIDECYIKDCADTYNSVVQITDSITERINNNIVLSFSDIQNFIRQEQDKEEKGVKNMNRRIDCSNLLNFKKEFKRMCESHIQCTHCPFYDKFNEDKFSNDGSPSCYPEEDLRLREITNKHIEILQKWSDEHPPKTLLEDLLERYPNTPFDDYGTPCFCPKALGYEKQWYCNNGVESSRCVDCWNRYLDEVKSN